MFVILYREYRLTSRLLYDQAPLDLNFGRSKSPQIPEHFKKCNQLFLGTLSAFPENFIEKYFPNFLSYFI